MSFPQENSKIKYMARNTRPRSFSFQRFARSYHLSIKNAEELFSVPYLDKAHWVATSAPTWSFNLDPVFLSFVDRDANGYIMHNDIIDAINWLKEILNNYSGLEAGKTSIQKGDINENTWEGKNVVSVLDKIFRHEKADERTATEGEVTFEQIRLLKEETEKQSTSAEGVILPEVAWNEEIRSFLNVVVITTGGKPHPSGNNGVDEECVNRFMENLESVMKWKEEGEKFRNASHPALNKSLAELYEDNISIFNKIDEYFYLCNLAYLNYPIKEYCGEIEISNTEKSMLSVLKGKLEEAPLAIPNQEGELRFKQALNLYYEEKLQNLRRELLIPFLGTDISELTFRQWDEVRKIFRDYEKWKISKPEKADMLLEIEGVGEYISSELKNKAIRFIRSRKESAFKPEALLLTEKVILFQAYLLNLVNNFVSFPYLYNPEKRAAFETGSLVMDGVHFNLAMKVKNRTRHQAMAKSSFLYVIYLEIFQDHGNILYEVAVPVTAGTSGNLFPGKSGIFIDTEGNEYNARIVEIVENPISVKEAIAAPFRRIASILTTKLESLASEAPKEIEKITTQGLEKVPELPATASSTSTRPGLLSGGGLILGGSVAIAVLGSSLAFIINTLAKLKWWEILIGIGSVILAVIIPISMVAILKLRKRDLSILLEASGWAINARIRLTHKLSKVFTYRPAYPKGSKGLRRLAVLHIILIILIIGVLLGIFLFFR